MQLDDTAERGPGGVSPVVALERLVAAATEAGPSRRSLGIGLVLVALAGVGGVAWWWTSTPEVVPVVPASLPMAGHGAAPGAPPADGASPHPRAPADQSGPADRSGPADGSGPAGQSGPTGQSASPAEATSTDEVVAHAAGAVTRPGVHRLPAGARVADLVAAAGGPAPDADLDRLNLAAPLLDGSRVHVPRVGEAPTAELPVVGPPGGGGPAADTGALVDLNAADADALDELPGVGPATAAAILDHRAQHGPFRSVDDLLAVAGIGPAKLDRLRPLVRV